MGERVEVGRCHTMASGKGCCSGDNWQAIHPQAGQNTVVHPHLGLSEGALVVFIK